MKKLHVCKYTLWDSKLHHRRHLALQKLAPGPSDVYLIKSQPIPGPLSSITLQWTKTMVFFATLCNAYLFYLARKPVKLQSCPMPAVPETQTASWMLEMLYSPFLTPILTTDCLVMTKIFFFETEAIHCSVLNGRCYLVFVMLASLSNLLILTSSLARSLAEQSHSEQKALRLPQL